MSKEPAFCMPDFQSEMGGSWAAAGGGLESGFYCTSRKRDSKRINGSWCRRGRSKNNLNKAAQKRARRENIKHRSSNSAADCDDETEEKSEYWRNKRRALIRQFIGDRGPYNEVEEEDSEDTQDTEFAKRYLDLILTHRKRDRHIFGGSSLYKNNRLSRSCDRMMIVPPVLITGLESDDEGLEEGGGGNRYYRSNSCYSDSIAHFLTASSLGSNPSSRRPSTLSAGGIAAVAARAAMEKANGNPGQKAYLLRQRSTGEEVVVTMAPVRTPVIGARTVVNQVPSYLARSGTFAPQMNTRKQSLDDQQVSYDSLMTPADYTRRFSEMVNSQDVLVQNRLEKMYQKCRSQNSETMSDEMIAPPAPRAAGSRRDRLDEWLVETDRRRRGGTCAVGEYAGQAAARAKTPLYLASCRSLHTPKILRSSSHAGAAGLNIPETESRRGSHCRLGRTSSTGGNRSFRGEKRVGSSSKESEGSNSDFEVLLFS